MGRTRRVAFAAVLGSAVLATACSNGTSINSPFSTSTPVLHSGPEYEVTTGSVSGLGTILVDGQGLTVYMYATDVRGAPSRCYGICAVQWPPVVLPPGSHRAGGRTRHPSLAARHDPSHGRDTPGHLQRLAPLPVAARPRPGQGHRSGPDQRRRPLVRPLPRRPADRDTVAVTTPPESTPPRARSDRSARRVPSSPSTPRDRSCPSTRRDRSSRSAPSARSCRSPPPAPSRRWRRWAASPRWRRPSRSAPPWPCSPTGRSGRAMAARSQSSAGEHLAVATAVGHVLLGRQADERRVGRVGADLGGNAEGQRSGRHLHAVRHHGVGAHGGARCRPGPSGARPSPNPRGSRPPGCSPRDGPSGR